MCFFSPTSILHILYHHNCILYNTHLLTVHFPLTYLPDNIRFPHPPFNYLDLL
jgi:hypothetical protein